MPIWPGGGDNPVVNVNGTVGNMLSEITSKRSGAVSIVDDGGHLLGLVTDYDIRMVLERGEDLFAVSITDIMNKIPTYICSDEKAITALDFMQKLEKPFLVLPILDRLSSKAVGMVHLHDLVSKGL